MIEKCEKLLSLGGRAFLLPSATQGLEIACRLSLKPGDECILPSFSHPSCTNAILLAGGVPVYADVSHETLNLEEGSTWASLRPETKAVMPIHYSGVSCGGWLKDISRQRGVTIIEDAAHSIGVFSLLGDFGVISFHQTKNIETGEGGVLIVSPKYEKYVETLIDFGTDRAKLMRGEQGFYSHIDIGFSGRMSEYLTPKLYHQLTHVDEINGKRMKCWEAYQTIRAKKASKVGNGHIFWFMTDNARSVIEVLRSKGIKAASHYEAAHLTRVGRKYGKTYTSIHVADEVADSIVRLPTDVSPEEAISIANTVNEVIS